MAIKNYKVEFFQLNLRPNADIDCPRTLLMALKDTDNYHTYISQGGYTREIWGIQPDRFPNSVSGQFRKFRTTDIPEIGSIGSMEEPIELDDGQGLIERNFFNYYEEHSIIAWHINSHASSINQFANFLSVISGCKITAEPILQPDAIQRLMSGNIDLKKVEFTIPRPTNPELYPDDDYGRDIIDLMNNVNADSLKLSMGVDLRRADSEGKMRNRLKNTLRSMVRLGATTARAHVFDNGIEHPIDLIADRVFSYQEIETNTNFPPNFTMYNLIDTAKAERQEELDGYFGSMENAIE